MHKRRKVAYPPTAGLNDKQQFRYVESGVLVSPYQVEHQTLEIELPKSA